MIFKAPPTHCLVCVFFCSTAGASAMQLSAITSMGDLKDLWPKAFEI